MVLEACRNGDVSEQPSITSYTAASLIFGWSQPGPYCMTSSYEKIKSLPSARMQRKTCGLHLTNSKAENFGGWEPCPTDRPRVLAEPACAGPYELDDMAKEKLRTSRTTKLRTRLRIANNTYTLHIYIYIYIGLYVFPNAFPSISLHTYPGYAEKVRIYETRSCVFRKFSEFTSNSLRYLLNFSFG